jgi:hypothetical protein
LKPAHPTPLPSVSMILIEFLFLPCLFCARIFCSKVSFHDYPLLLACERVRVCNSSCS